MRRLTLLFLLALPAARDEEPIAPTEVIRLFNGKDLSGFTGWLSDTKREDPRNVYSVKDGLLRISGDGFGYLSTEQAYRDYHLIVEFKWGTKNWRGRQGKARDSGIFLHTAGPDGNSYDANGAFKAAIECQVMQGCTGDLMVIGGKGRDGKRIPITFSAEVAPEPGANGWATWKEGGRKVVMKNFGVVNWVNKDKAWKDTLDFRGKADVESPVDAWTRVECLCEGSTITVKVNGKGVNHVRDAYPTGGKILLQCEGSEIFFRKVELRPLRE